LDSPEGEEGHSGAVLGKKGEWRSSSEEPERELKKARRSYKLERKKERERLLLCDPIEGKGEN